MLCSLKLFVSIFTISVPMFLISRKMLLLIFVQVGPANDTKVHCAAVPAVHTAGGNKCLVLVRRWRSG